ncbi:MAG: cell wall hydrolase [Oscillospiraceae bacterium]|nr:cell wall hydrolase [Oscillospiraceae bacterium]
MRIIKYVTVILFILAIVIFVPREETGAYASSTRIDLHMNTPKPSIPVQVLKSSPVRNTLLPVPEPPRRWTDQDVVTLSRMVWGEGRGVTRNEQKLIVWTVLNRLDNGRYGNSIRAVVTARGQFVGYQSSHPVTEPIRGVVIYVLEAWDRGEAAKVYPPFARTPYYLYFHGDGRHNWFRERFR